MLSACDTGIRFPKALPHIIFNKYLSFKHYRLSRKGKDKAEDNTRGGVWTSCNLSGSRSEHSKLEWASKSNHSYHPSNTSAYHHSTCLVLWAMFAYTRETRMPSDSQVALENGQSKSSSHSASSRGKIIATTTIQLQVILFFFMFRYVLKYRNSAKSQVASFISKKIRKKKYQTSMKYVIS